MSSADQPATAVSDKVLNVNLGVLGHVDSGKTSLGTSFFTLVALEAL